MEIKGTQQIAAARTVVWDALLDPVILRACLPGCESVERLSQTEFQVVVAMAIGPLRARFKGRLAVTQQHAPQSCVMVFQGEGGAVGFGKGSSTVELKEQGSNTELSYVAAAEVGGKLAQVGSRLIESVARKISDDFFAAFKTQLAGGTGAAEALPNSQDGAPATGATDNKTGAVPKRLAAAPAASALLAAAPDARVMVPGWWLLVSAFAGALATMGGMLMSR